MPPLRRRLLVCVIVAGLSAGATARGRAAPAPQRSPTAHCSDGTYYFGPRSRKACAHHRGVSEWLAASRRPAASGGARAKGAPRGRAAAVPRGATARCRDGTYSFVRTRGRACAEHRGIARWLRAR
jgi:hypothetical protein